MQENNTIWAFLKKLIYVLMHPASSDHFYLYCPIFRHIFLQNTKSDILVQADCTKHFCFVHPIFRFWFFGNEVTEIQKYFVILVYIMQGKRARRKKQKENP